MQTEGNIITYLRLRSLGSLKNWPRGKIIILARPNFEEDCWFYD